MGLINHQNNLNFVINVKKSLNKERVGDFVLLSFIVAEPGTIIKGHILNDGSSGDGSLRILFVTNFYN